MPTVRFSKVDVTAEFESSREIVEVLASVMNQRGFSETPIPPKITAEITAAPESEPERRRGHKRRRQKRAPLESKISIKDTVIEVIRSGAKTNDEVIRAVLGTKATSSEGTINHYLYKLSADRVIHKGDDLKWRIVQKPPRP